MPPSQQQTRVMPDHPDSKPESASGREDRTESDLSGRLQDQAALADLAFGSLNSLLDPIAGGAHLAFASADDLILDLDVPAQRELGDYRLIELLGRGGMGVVYRAHQLSLDREVALKLLAAGPWASADFIERFRREAQSAARMQHPNIVAIHEFGQHRGLNFFSMRIVHGPSLATRLDREGPLPPREAASLLRTVAEAVEYAHRLNVLHLDLKPGNVLIDESGQPLVADFGLARRLDQVLVESAEDVSGTPSYMAPEQAEAGSLRIGRATDIYGLGAILYELLTGRPPFLGPTPQSTLQRVVSSALTPPRELNPRIPLDLDAICRHCLERDPAQRYASAAALAADLANFLGDRAISIRIPAALERARRWVRREPRFAAAVAGVGLALIVGLAATAQQWRRAEGNAAQSRALLWEGRRESALQLEQDGRGFEAWPRLLDNLREQEAAATPDAAGMERRRLGLLFGQGARLIDRIVVPDASPMATEVSPDGRRVAVAFNDLSVRWYDSTTLQERGRIELAGRPTSDGQPRAPLLLRFASDDRLRVSLEWYGNLSNPSEGDAWLIDLDRGALIEPPADFADFADVIYAADGRHALLRNGSGEVQFWQVQPWRALSGLQASNNIARSWILDAQGRYAVHLGVAMRKLLVYRLPQFELLHESIMPNDSGVSAWAASHDGRHLALGDFEGRLYLLDPERWNLRALPTGRSREILWLSFSEDDAWLASASFDGNVQAFDVATGDTLAAGQMRHDFPVRRVGINRAQRLLIAAGAGQTALWRLARPGARALPPRRIGLAPAPHGLAGRYPIGWSFASGLLASAGMDGQIRLWRLPLAPSQGLRSAHQMPEWFAHRRRVADVAWDRLRLATLDDRESTPWQALPQAPGFAEFVDAERLLLVTTGPRLQVYDTASMRLRHAPIALPETPQRLLPDGEGRRVLFVFGAHEVNGHENRLRLLDAHDGTWHAGETTLPGELMRLARSDDGRRLLAVGAADGATRVLDATTLDTIGEYPHDPFEPVVWASFVGDRVALATRADDRRLGSDSLLIWNPDRDEIEARHDTGLARPRGVRAAPGGLFVFGAQADLLIDSEGRTRALSRIAQSESSALVALSPDGRLLAHAFRNEVQLHDAMTGELVGPPLGSDAPPTDYLGALAFAPQGDALIGRTSGGYWLRWPTPTEGEAVTALGQQLERLGLGRDGTATLHPPTPGERHALRAADPGAWTVAGTRPRPALSPDAPPALGVPARSPELPPHLLDLSSVYRVGPETMPSTYHGFRPSQRAYPMGRQRIGGIDFDARGVASVGLRSWGEDESTWIIGRPLQCVPTPDAPVRAVHLLTDASLPIPAVTGTVLAELTVHYRDGPSSVLPLRAGIELPGHAGDDARVPVTFVPETALPMSGYEGGRLMTPRLALPEPTRALRCLDLATVESGAVLSVLAITLEPSEARIIPNGDPGIEPTPAANADTTRNSSTPGSTP